MTMAVGFICYDGIVIAADRQVTGRHYTFEESKMTSFMWANGHGVLAYAGERDTQLEVARQFKPRFELAKEMSPADIREALSESLSATLRKKEVFQTLFGYWNNDTPQVLLMSNGNDRVVDVPQCEVIGYGDSPLARFLLGRLTEISQYGVSVRQARVYATYFISQAKKYDGQYVGGGIDIYSIDHSCKYEQLCTRLIKAGREWEDEINLFQNKMDLLFHRVADTKNDLKCEIAMREFSPSFKRFKNWIGIKGWPWSK
ncbi:MAG TPA: hypothetical protein VI386_18710 [Candidatus Sulfotelmatobacter sp.]